ncbi:MAG: TetR/AcrR family transcriptional regulator [Deltaproteobacteria bacterium]|nr:TetR/AcrR family transcriptional regulator [Deltaproteobacteria bacterium]
MIALRCDEVVDMAIVRKNYQKIRYEIKKNDILENAAKMFLKKGFEKAALEDIAHELKMTKGSLYYYIKSKEDMLFQCIMKANKMANDVLEGVEKMDLPPAEKLRQAILGHTKVLTTDFVVGVLRQQELLLPTHMRDTVIHERDRFEKKFLAIVKEGIRKETFQKEDWKMRAYAILGALNWIPRWYTPDGKLSPEEIGEAMANYLIRGLLNPEMKDEES